VARIHKVAGVQVSRAVDARGRGPRGNRADWETIVRAVVEHTSLSDRILQNMTASAQSTATAEGAAWSAGASGWVEYWAGARLPLARVTSLPFLRMTGG
jgi:hypothetical protein